MQKKMQHHFAKILQIGEKIVKSNLARTTSPRALSRANFSELIIQARR